MKRFRNKDGSAMEYLYIVKGVRVDGKPRQKVAYLGRLDDLRREGAIDSLVEGLARYAERARVADVAEKRFIQAAKEHRTVLVSKCLRDGLALTRAQGRTVMRPLFQTPAYLFLL
nr:hypothetical protein [Bacillota bacterium]